MRAGRAESGARSLWRSARRASEPCPHVPVRADNHSQQHSQRPPQALALSLSIGNALAASHRGTPNGDQTQRQRSGFSTLLTNASQSRRAVAPAAAERMFRPADAHPIGAALDETREVVSLACEWGEGGRRAVGPPFGPKYASSKPRPARKSGRPWSRAVTEPGPRVPVRAGNAAPETCRGRRQRDTTPRGEARATVVASVTAAPHRATKDVHPQDGPGVRARGCPITTVAEARRVSTPCSARMLGRFSSMARR